MLTLRKYQADTVELIEDKKNLALFLSMGLGKTAICLHALNNLKARALIIAPLQICKSVWQTERDKWDELKHLNITTAIGQKQQKISAFGKGGDIHITNVETTTLLVELLFKKQIQFKWDVLIIDESTIFKNQKSKRFKALKRLLKHFKMRWILTGTPNPNNLYDLWSQMFIVDLGESLGSRYSEFLHSHFSVMHSFPYLIKPLAGTQKKIERKIKNNSVSISLHDKIDLPPINTVDIKLKGDKKFYQQYNDLLRKECITIDTETILIDSASEKLNKLMQLCNGFIYNNDSASRLNDFKVNYIETLLEAGSRFLLVYNYKHDFDRLSKLKNVDVLTDNNIVKWNNKEIQCLLVHEATASRGLNLQHGGSVVVWYGLTYNLENYLQMNARVYRSGQNEKVFIYHLTLDKTIEHVILEALKRKEVSMNSLLEHVRRF